MTDFTLRVRLNELAPEEEVESAKIIAQSFCQSFDVLLGVTSEKICNGQMYWAVWGGIPDEKFQAVEEIVEGSTVWSCELHSDCNRQTCPICSES